MAASWREVSRVTTDQGNCTAVVLRSSKRHRFLCQTAGQPEVEVYEFPGGSDMELSSLVASPEGSYLAWIESIVNSGDRVMVLDVRLGRVQELELGVEEVAAVSWQGEHCLACRCSTDEDEPAITVDVRTGEQLGSSTDAVAVAAPEAVAPRAFVRQSWPSVWGPCSRSRFLAGELRPPLTLRWRAKLPRQEGDGECCGGNGRVFMGVKRQNLLALDLANGKPLWEATAIRGPGEIFYEYHAPWIIAGQGVVAEQDGQRQVSPPINANAARPFVGRRRNQIRVLLPGRRFGWLDLQSLTLGEPDSVRHWALAESYDIYVNARDGKEELVCVDAGTLQVRWSRSRESLTFPLMCTDEVLVVLTGRNVNGQKEYAVLDPQTGCTKWLGCWSQFENFGWYGLALGLNGIVSVGRENNTPRTDLRCLDLQSGAEIWRHALRYVVTPTITGSIVWTVCIPSGGADREFMLTAWDCVTGKQLAAVGMPTKLPSPYEPFIKAVIDDCIIVNAGRELLCFQATTA